MSRFSISSISNKVTQLESIALNRHFLRSNFAQSLTHIMANQLGLVYLTRILDRNRYLLEFGVLSYG